MTDSFDQVTEQINWNHCYAVYVNTEMLRRVENKHKSGDSGTGEHLELLRNLWEGKRQPGKDNFCNNSKWEQPKPCNREYTTVYAWLIIESHYFTNFLNYGHVLFYKCRHHRQACDKKKKREIGTFTSTFFIIKIQNQHDNNISFQVISVTEKAKE